MDFSFETPGLAQYEKMLLQMPTKVARSIGRAAVRRGANVILQEARRLARAGHPDYPNRRTGLLAKSIRTRDKGIHGDSVTFAVQVRARAFYAHFLEYGTIHAKPYPLMRPAVEHSVARYVTTLSDYLGTRIQAEWRNYHATR